jgi:putative transposase
MRYTSDLTDAQWQLVEYCFPAPSRIGRPREHAPRELLNAVFYVVTTGCQWRNLPTDFPRWGTTYHYFRTWKRNGLWQTIHDHLREQVRLVDGREAQPSAAIIDSQRVKSSECSEERGFDAGKKINGRKRHILVDTLGLLLGVVVLPANIQDRDGAKTLLAEFFRHGAADRMLRIWADSGYAGALLDWTLQTWQCVLEIVKRTELHKFKILPRRWVVERTFSWLARSRRMSRDYERQASTGESMMYLAMIRLMLRRLAS